MDTFSSSSASSSKIWRGWRALGAMESTWSSAKRAPGPAPARLGDAVPARRPSRWRMRRRRAAAGDEVAAVDAAGAGDVPRCGGISAPEPRPSPRRGALLACRSSAASNLAPRVSDLRRGLEVARRAPGARVVRHDRLAVARRLRHPHVARDDRGQHRSPKCARTSCSTASARRVRRSYIVSSTVVTSSCGFRWSFTSWMLLSAAARPPARSTRTGSGS